MGEKTSSDFSQVHSNWPYECKQDLDHYIQEAADLPFKGRCFGFSGEQHILDILDDYSDQILIIDKKKEK